MNLRLYIVQKFELRMNETKNRKLLSEQNQVPDVSHMNRLLTGTMEINRNRSDTVQREFFLILGIETMIFLYFLYDYLLLTS